MILFRIAVTTALLVVLGGHAVAAGGNDYKELYQRGVELNKKGEFEEAVKYYSKAIALKPDSAPIYFVRGRAYMQMEMASEAIGDFSKAVALKPDYAEAYNLRGVTYLGKGQLKPAEADYRKACGLGLKDACENLKKLQQGGKR
jgi:tetratricopeptide (TPR) repeat protein